MKHILVVVDMQKDFVDGALGTPEAVCIIPKVAEKIRNFEGIIFVTMDTHHIDYLYTTEGRNLPVPHCIKGTPGWTLHDDIAAALEGKTYTMVEKPTFGSVELPELVESAVGPGQFTVELVGLCTDICVVSNALLLKANFPEMQIFVDSRCCAGVTPESHDAALTTMKMCQITVKGGNEDV
jgi:nicotinamidase-related amidase